MSLLTLHDLSSIKGGRLTQPADAAERLLTGVSIDSRTVKSGDVFFAIKGERFDGHSFVPDAVRKGAQAIVVSLESIPPESFERDGIIILQVPDTTRALGELAAIHRRKFDIPVIAVTGTNGKTTTKEMIYSALSQQYKVIKSPGNFNNQYGLPLTLFQMTPETDIAVAELGANYPGEIALLCDIALPTHGVITNIGKGHIEFFKSEDEVLRTKAALLHAVQGKGTGFISGDDRKLRPYADQLDNVLTFGVDSGADFRGKHLDMKPGGGFEFTIADRLKISLRVPGRKNVYNALAAAAVGLTIGMNESKVRAGLESFKGFKQRMAITDWNGVTIIDDSYNANPDSMKASLEFIEEYPASGRRFAVLGEMLELGSVSEKEHETVGGEAASRGIDRLITVGDKARLISEAAKSAGLRESVNVNDHNKAAHLLHNELKPGDILLVKGSRGGAIEKVLEYLYGNAQ